MWKIWKCENVEVWKCRNVKTQQYNNRKTFSPVILILMMWRNLKNGFALQHRPSPSYGEGERDKRGELTLLFPRLYRNHQKL